MENQLLELTDDIRTYIFMSGHASRALLRKKFKCQYYYDHNSRTCTHLFFNTEKDKTWFLLSMKTVFEPGDLMIHYFQDMSKSYYEHHEHAGSL